MMNVILTNYRLPQHMWGKAILLAKYLLNRTLDYIWKERKFSYNYLKVWGYINKVFASSCK